MTAFEYAPGSKRHIYTLLVAQCLWLASSSVSLVRGEGLLVELVEKRIARRQPALEKEDVERKANAQAARLQGWVNTVQAVTSLLWGPIVANLMDAFGRKWLVTLAPLGGTVLTLGMALRPSLPMYLLHSALSNPFAVTQMRAQSVMVSDIVPRSTMEFWFISRHPSERAWLYLPS